MLQNISCLTEVTLNALFHIGSYSRSPVSLSGGLKCANNRLAWGQWGSLCEDQHQPELLHQTICKRMCLFQPDLWTTSSWLHLPVLRLAILPLNRSHKPASLWLWVVTFGEVHQYRVALVRASCASGGLQRTQRLCADGRARGSPFPQNAVGASCRDWDGVQGC